MIPYAAYAQSADPEAEQALKDVYGGGLDKLEQLRDELRELHNL